MDQDQARSVSAFELRCLSSAVWLTRVVRRDAEYMDQMGERIDGLVVGGYWGQGHRSGFLASYLIGLRDEVSGKVVCALLLVSGEGETAAD